VSKGRVLIIEHDEWESALLAKFLGEAGYEIHVASEARAGFEKVRELLPDCVLCNVDLPDVDGFWVARRVRSEPTKVASAPFVFLTDAEDMESRLQGLNVGADLYLTKPFHNEEVVAQVSALIEMANRLRNQRETSDGPSSATGNAAFQGDIAQMSVATVLTLLELEKRTGQLKIKTDTGTAMLELDDGALASANMEGDKREPIGLLREALHWKKGSFIFRGAPVKPGIRQTITGLLLEAMRLEDESKR
jgi:two-component system OmpR family response regulator